MQYFIGVDIGTTSVKSVAFDGNGKLLHVFRNEYPMFHSSAHCSEQDASFIYDAVIEALRKTIAACEAKPAFISFSAAMHSIMAVDDNGNPLTPLIIWADNRSMEIADQLHEQGRAHFFYSRTGVPVHPMSPLCKLIWLKQNEPSIFNAANKFIGIKEYVFHRLFKRFVVDTSVASATGLLNIHTLQWDEDILLELGLNAFKLSQVVSTQSSYVFQSQEIEFDFLHAVPFVIGASDGALSNIGTHSTGDIMAVTIGTSGAARLMSRQPLPDELMRTFCYHANDSSYITGGAGNNGAVVLQWLKEEILETSGDYETFFDKAMQVPAGADGLVMLPYILGERAPIWNASAKAVLFGLTKNHKQAHLIRAAMEAVVYSMYSIAKVLMQQHPVKEIHASGGFARTALWLQILADVFNLPVHVSGAYEAPAYGAVMLGAEALHIECNFEKGIIASYFPSAANNKVYMGCFRKFEKLYALLKQEMNE